MDSMVSNSVLEIGRVVQDARQQTESGLSLLPCNESRFISADYPILASCIENKYIENAVELTAIEHANITNYHANTTEVVTETDGTIHIITSGNADNSGIKTSTDGGVTFSDFVQFTSLIAIASLGYGAIKASGDGQTLVMCKNLTIYVSTDRGATWNARTAPTTGNGTYYQYYDVSPNGQNILCVTNVYSSTREYAKSSDGGVTWTTYTSSSQGAEDYFQFSTDTRIVWLNRSSSYYNAYYTTFGSAGKTIGLDDPGGSPGSIVAKGSYVIAQYGSYGGTTSDYERLYLSTNGGASYIKLPYRKDIFGNYLNFGTISDFQMMPNGDLFVNCSGLILLLKSGASEWINAYDIATPAGRPSSPFFASYGDDLFIASRYAFYKTKGDITPYSFFTPPLDDGGVGSVYKLVGDAQ